MQHCHHCSVGLPVIYWRSYDQGICRGIFRADFVADIVIENACARLPAALVPPQITDYVSRIHAEQTIVKISKDTRGWDIELSNGIEIEFDKKYNVVDFDD